MPLKSMRDPSSMTQRLAALRRSHLAVVFSSMVASQLGSAALGLAFWALAAHLLRPAEVGVGAALVAAMNLFSVFGVMGVGTLLMEQFKLDRLGVGPGSFSTALVVAGLGGALFASLAAVATTVLPISGVLHSLAWTTGLLLAGATMFASICMGFDQAVHGMGQSGSQLKRNIAASVVRIALLFLATKAGVDDGRVILVSWSLGLAISLLCTRVRSTSPSGPRVRIKQRMAYVRDHWRIALGHHSLSLAMVSSSLMLPIVVALTLPAIQMAYFTSARLLSDSALMLPYFLTVALFAAVHNIDEFREKARKTILLGLGIAVMVMGGGAIFGRILLLTFGSEYSDVSWGTLMLLLAAGPVLVVKDHFVALRRIQGRRGQGAIALTLWTAAELSGALAGGLLSSIKYLCIGWLVMSALCSLAALPVLVRALKREPRGHGELEVG